MIALSGGRDSTYILYYIVKVLNLKVLAYSIDNGFIPEQTKLNLQQMVDTLKVPLVIEKDTNLENCIKHHILSFIHKPSAPMIGMLCTGCRLGLTTKIAGFARRNNIPLIVTGNSPVDAITIYKTRLMSLKPDSSSKALFILGYLSQITRNPKWILNYTCLVTHIKEYYHYFYKKEFRSISPFFSYIKWDEEKITSTIQNELNWRKNPDTKSNSRGDCDVALLKSYLYKKALGYNDKDVQLSYLIMEDQISRGEALGRLKEEEVSEDAVEMIFDKLQLNFLDLKMSLTQSSSFF